ncbi:MAG TPA: PepSY-associated TM helix domain-containing protein [Polyangiaceae bacterium]|nr:PepSY-associated TM helix domain-containing protein [Polyangiaceae bacterium]
MRAALVFLRIVLSLLGGYAFSAAVSAGLAWGLPRVSSLPRGEAVVLAGMLGFVIYLGVLLWAFGWPGQRNSAPPASFRRSMSLLHTWAGVLLGAVLFVVFWMGTLSVFDREIDRWMMPSTRLGPATGATSLDDTARKVAEQLAPGAKQWSITLPTERTPVLQLRYPDPVTKDSVLRYLDPQSGTLLAEPGTRAGTGFIFPFHFSLHIAWLDLGIWLVGLAAMAMLVLLVSGVVIHVHFFKELFTFRPHKALSRSSLDLHTTLGVLVLPFHFVMPLSGLFIFFSLFFPATWQAAFQGDRAAFNREVFGSYQRPRADQPAALGSLDALKAQAEQLWGEGTVSSLRVLHPGDAASYVEVRRTSADQVSLSRQQLVLDAATGSVLAREEGGRPVLGVQRFVAGIHFLQFDNWTLRWLYFLAGLAGCTMIATGFLFWLESRRSQHARQGLAGVRVVDALTIGSVTGIIAATFAFFVANRLLPARASLFGMPRDELEMLVFYASWLVTFVHAALRARAAWAEQCWAIAGLGLAAVVLNVWTTGDHVWRALERGAFGVAGMDLLLLGGAALGAASARRLERRPRASALRAPSAPLKNPAVRGEAHG